MSPLTVFHFDDPEIGVHTALFGKRGIDCCFGAFGEQFPAAAVCEKVKTALESLRAAIKGVEFYQHCTCSIVAVFDDESRDLMETEACEVGRDPEFRGQPCHALPSLKSRPISE